MQLIHSGFSAQAEIEDEQVSCTSFSITTNENVLESSGGFGATINPAVENSPSATKQIGMNGPFIFDATDVSGSISYEPTHKQLTDVANWINERNESKKIIFHVGDTSGDNNKLEFKKAFWESITVNASADSLLTVDLNTWTYQQEWLEIDDHITIGGLSPRVSSGTPVGGATETDPNKHLIPYWSTSIEGLPNSDILNWTLTITQPLVKKYYCGGQVMADSAPLPGDVYVGPLEITFSSDIIIAKNPVKMSDIIKKGTTSDNISIYHTYTSNNTEHKKLLMKLEKVVFTGLNPTLDDASGANSLTLNYKTYLIKKHI